MVKLWITTANHNQPYHELNHNFVGTVVYYTAHNSSENNQIMRTTLQNYCKAHHFSLTVNIHEGSCFNETARYL